LPTRFRRKLKDDTGVKFGVLQISLFAGMVYEDKHEVEKAVTSEQAQNIISHFEMQGYINDKGKLTESAKEAAKTKSIELPAELEPVKEKIAEIITSDDMIEPSTITKLTYTETISEEKQITYEDAQELMEHFEKKGYITSAGKMKDTMKNALKAGILDLPKKYEAARERFETIIANADRKPPVRDASRDVVVRINKQVMVSPEFMELWNKIKQKTAYRVEIDTETLIRNCVKDLQDMPPVPKARLVSQTADIHIEKSGIYHTERELRTEDIEHSYQTLPDIIDIISDEALLTPATVNEILVQSGRGKDFLHNPQAFLEKAVEIIRDNRHALAIDGIKYIKLDGKEYYAQEIFDSAELMANLDRNAVKVEHSVYDYIVYDSSSIERPFAVALDNDPDVKLFFKIPERFKIETPIGTYNPDWAVYLTKNGEEKLYFVVETKGSLNPFDRRGYENLKIHCGKQHFKALADGIDMQVATSWPEFKKKI
jgi:type III restriction enzyme